MRWRFLLFFIFIVYALPVFSTTPKSVLILPFNLYTQQDLSYLKLALPQMLASRIFSPGKVEAIDPEKVLEVAQNYPQINRENALLIGEKLKADYVIFGSITQVGEVVSVDAQIIDLSAGKKPAKFFQEIKGLSDLIPQLSRFARKSQLYIEGKEEDFYREDLFLNASGQPYVPGRYHPERGFLGYPVYPYPMVPREEEPKVTRAKSRFGEDPTYDGLTKNLVIDLSGSKPIIGFAKDEEEGNKTAKGQAKPPQPPYGYYPPQPYYNYSPPPYYYYTPQEESLFDKIWQKVWPFGKKDPQVRPTPQPYQPQPTQPQMRPPQPPIQSNQPSPQKGTPTPPQPSSPQMPPQKPTKANPWSWE